MKKGRGRIISIEGRNFYRFRETHTVMHISKNVFNFSVLVTMNSCLEYNATVGKLQRFICSVLKFRSFEELRPAKQFLWDGSDSILK